MTRCSTVAASSAPSDDTFQSEQRERGRTKLRNEACRGVRSAEETNLVKLPVEYESRRQLDVSNARWRELSP